MAFDMLDSIVTVTNPTNNEKLKIRIGSLLTFISIMNREFLFLYAQVVIVVQ